MAEGERNIRPDAEREARTVPEISEEYLGDVSARLFELQGEKAQLEGEKARLKGEKSKDASPAELRRLNAEIGKIDAEIAPLQAFVDERAEEYARMEMPREITRTVRVPEKLRVAKTETPRDLRGDLKDLQKRYDLTAEQLASETDPEARVKLESNIDGLRERIHGLEADKPWENEDRALAKGGIKRSSTARLKAKEPFKAAEIDRALLVDLRADYAKSLESGSLSKAGETLIHGALQTLDDALARYGRGDLSTEAFQDRVKDITQARPTWDRYVKDENKAEPRKQENQRDLAERTHELTKRTKAAITRAEEKAARTEETAKARKAEQNEEIKRRLKEVGEKQDAEKALRVAKKQSAEAQAEVEKTVAMEVALSEAARKRAETRVRIAEKMDNIKEQTRVRSRADVKETLADIRNMPAPPTDEEVAEDRRQADDLVGAMEAGPNLAPPPENLPVAPERHATREDISAKVALYKGYTKQGREGMYQIILTAASSMNALSARERAMVASQYPEWTTEDFRGLREGLDRINRERGAAAAFTKEVTAKADALVEDSINRTMAKVYALQKKVHAEKERVRKERNELRPGEEESWSAQGENPEELAKRTEPIERYAGQAMTPDQAVAANEEIKEKDARDFENEQNFTAAFLKAAEQDPSHRVDMGHAEEYVKQYWDLLMKENARLAEAMKPQPKVGFFRRLLGGAPKPKDTMTPQEVIQFQKMDKLVREIMETPAIGQRSEMFRAGMRGSTPSRPAGIERRPPR